MNDVYIEHVSWRAADKYDADIVACGGQAFWLTYIMIHPTVVICHGIVDDRRRCAAVNIAVGGTRYNVQMGEVILKE